MSIRKPINFPITEKEPTLQVRKAIPTLSKIKKPLAKVRLKTTNGQWSPKIQVLVDTGAVISVFTKSWCDVIGLKLENGECVTLGTAGKSKILIYIHTVDIQLDGEELNGIHVGFREEEKGTSLLGMIDVFDSFEVNFKVKQTRNEFPS